MNGRGMQALFKRSRHNKFIFFYNQSRFIRIAKTLYQSQWDYISCIQTKQIHRSRQNIHGYDP